MEAPVVYLYDRRIGDKPEEEVSLGGVSDFKSFRQQILGSVASHDGSAFVITNSSRQEINDDSSYEDLVVPGSTLYLLESTDQELVAPTDERIDYVPHYDTLVKSGIYEYYASEGQNPLPYAFAELIDNALTATAKNEGERNIDLYLYLEDSPAVCIFDNGRGMTSRQLNHWAIYRLSKFLRNRSGGGDLNETFVQEKTPRSLNSDISYFGVGGKQAIFFIGTACRMISKTLLCGDVHELSMSKEEFEAKEKERKSVFSGRIRNRRCGDSSHLQGTGQEILKKLIEEEEKNREQFTAVFISGIAEKNVRYLTKNFVTWSRQLAHIYHYYLHGPQGNVGGRRERASSPFKQINITIHMKAGRDSKKLPLHLIDDDMQTRYIRLAKSTFEFKVEVPNAGEVEGVLRYHPFEYDHETYPVSLDAEEEQSDTEDVEDAVQPSRKARGNRAMFECFWNGRLIPYTTIDGLEFCEPSKPSKRMTTTIPLECYSRISGCLFTNDAFQVSTNKLTFIDLPVKLKEKGNNIIYSVVTPDKDGRPVRDVRKHFHHWLRDCHENFDKEVKFIDQMETDVRREDIDIKRRQHPWCVYRKIELDGKTYKTGDLVRTCRTNPIVCGRVVKFWLYGRHEGDTFANTGQMEMQQEPALLYNDVKFYPLTKLDRQMEETDIQRIINEEESRLPKLLEVRFPEGNEVKEKCKVTCGKALGPVQVQILNGKGESIGRLPGIVPRKLGVVQSLTCSGKEICKHVGEYSSRWFYWFRVISELQSIGPHTLKLQAVVLDSDKQPTKLQLPSSTINFTVTEGPATGFKIAPLEGPYRVGEPFQIQLQLYDEYNNPARLPPESEPQLSAAGVSFAVKDGVTKSNTVTIRGVVATAKVNSCSGQTFKLKIAVLTIQPEPAEVNLRLIPGLPRTLECVPPGPVSVENRSPLQLTVHVKDSSGNLTADTRLKLVCKLSEGEELLPVYKANCNNGVAVFTGEDIVVNKPFTNKKTSHTLEAKISVVGVDQIPSIEEKVVVTPSSAPSKIVVYRQPEGSNVKKQLVSDQEVSAPVGTTVEGLIFVVLDESGKEVDVSGIASNVKVNWTNKLNIESVKESLLPDIPVPSSVSETKYCEVSLSGMGAECNFQVKPTVGPFKALKCSASDRRVKVKQTEDAVITVQCTDTYGNLLPNLPSNFIDQLKVTGSDLDTHELTCTASADDTVEVKGIAFKKVDLGIRELTVEHQGITAYVTLEVVAGSPAKVKFLHYDPQEPIYVYNESLLPAPLVVQLYDKFGNMAPEANVKIALGKTSGFKFEPPTHQQKTNEEGQVNFGQLTVSGAKGEYTITPRATLPTNQQVYGESLHIHIQPDSSKAVEIKIGFTGSMTCIAGTHLPDSEISIIAEDLHVMTNVMAPHIAMGIKESLAEDIPENVQLISPPEAGPADSGVFYFKRVPAPERSGQYSIMINYISAEARLISPMFAVEVEPALPCRLVPSSHPPTATVSNQARANNRQLVKNLELQLQDVFNNVCSQETVKGKVTVTVVSSRNVPTPQLATVSTTFLLEKGICIIKELLVKENCPGQDGEQYLLRFELSLPGFPALRIPPFDFQFLFYDDVKKQREMAQLTRQRDQLSEFLRTCSTMFQSSQQIINEYESKVREYAVQEQQMKQDLRRTNVPPECLVSADAVDNYIGKCTVDKERLAQAPRRQCLLPAVGGHDPEILGKIAHLAQVVEDDIARVLSWHMASDMDCVVTMTTVKAKEVYRQSHGNQQVLPLDGIYRRNLPDWNRPLPHAKGVSRTPPPGNPVYARDLLLFPRDPENCKIVFGMLLGETIIIDSLDDATTYRQEVVKYTHCPTILTRMGDRIRSNGKFGGLQNRAPPLDRMRGAVFSAPLPQAYATICQQMERLQAYRQVLMKHDTAKRELLGQKERMETPEMAAKREDMRKAEEKLKEIETQLGIRTSDSYRQQLRPSPALQASAAPTSVRRSQTMHEDNEPLAKRMRSSTARPAADANAQEDLGRRRAKPSGSAETPKKRGRYA